jgi:hypothetical protein
MEIGDNGNEEVRAVEHGNGKIDRPLNSQAKARGPAQGGPAQHAFVRNDGKSSNEGQLPKPSVLPKASQEVAGHGAIRGNMNDGGVGSERTMEVAKDKMHAGATAETAAVSKSVSHDRPVDESGRGAEMHPKARGKFKASTPNQAWRQQAYGQRAKKNRRRGRGGCQVCNKPANWCKCEELPNTEAIKPADLKSLEGMSAAQAVEVLEKDKSSKEEKVPARCGIFDGPTLDAYIAAGVTEFELEQFSEDEYMEKYHSIALKQSARIAKYMSSMRAAWVQMEELQEKFGKGKIKRPQFFIKRSAPDTRCSQTATAFCYTVIAHYVLSWCFMVHEMWLGLLMLAFSFWISYLAIRKLWAVWKAGPPRDRIVDIHSGTSVFFYPVESYTDQNFRTRVNPKYLLDRWATKQKLDGKKLSGPRYEHALSRVRRNMYRELARDRLYDDGGVPSFSETVERLFSEYVDTRNVVDRVGDMLIPEHFTCTYVIVSWCAFTRKDGKYKARELREVHGVGTCSPTVLLNSLRPKLITAGSLKDVEAMVFNDVARTYAATRYSPVGFIAESTLKGTAALALHYALDMYFAKTDLPSSAEDFQ